MDSHIHVLKNTIRSAVTNGIERGAEIAVMYSGGLDSSLVALLARDSIEGGDITLYTVGTVESQDISNADHASRLMGVRLKKIEIQGEDIVAAVPKLAKIIATCHPVKISYELPLYLGLANIQEELILSGQGADELFGGYARYLRMVPEDLEKALIDDLDGLLTKDIQMDHRIAKHFRKNLQTPYLDDEVVRVSMQIPIEYKVKDGQRKIILKRVARELGLPLELVNQPKRAAQYSSGVIKSLRKAAKKKGLGVNELIDELLRG